MRGGLPASFDTRLSPTNSMSRRRPRTARWIRSDRSADAGPIEFATGQSRGLPSTRGPGAPSSPLRYAVESREFPRRTLTIGLWSRTPAEHFYGRVFRRRRRALGGGAPALFGARKSKAPLWNVLFIGVDDLRPDLGCYGNRRVHTPNIDRLAAAGLTFTRAYCQQAVGSPSRTSLMTGRRPDTTRVYDLETHFRRYLPGARTLPEQFKRAGYTSTAFGKVFHKPRLDDFPSWSIPSWMPDGEPWNSEANRSSARDQWDALRAANWISRERVYYEPAQRHPRPAGSGWGMPSWESRASPMHLYPTDKSPTRQSRD